MIKMLTLTNVDGEKMTKTHLMKYNKPTSQRNLLFVSKMVYHEAIDMYWRTSMVWYIWEDFGDLIPPTSLGTRTLARISNISMENRRNVEDVIRHLPNLKKLHLRNESLIRDRIGMEDSRLEAVTRRARIGKAHEVFSSVPQVLQRFPRLELIGQIDAFIEADDQRGVTVVEERVSSRPLEFCPIVCQYS